MEHTLTEPFTAEPTDVALWATDSDGRPGRTPGQAEGGDPDEAEGGAGHDAQDDDPQATPDQAEGEDEDA